MTLYGSKSFILMYIFLLCIQKIYIGVRAFNKARELRNRVPALVKFQALNSVEFIAATIRGKNHSFVRTKFLSWHQVGKRSPAPA